MLTSYALHESSPQERFSPQYSAPLASPTVATSTPKILLYSHDTAGLGNIRRTLLLAETLQGQYPRSAILIVTGSPMIHAFRIPDGIDYIKLPCLDRVDADRYEPRYLTACATEVKQTRKIILINVVLGFQPDLMIVDKRPSGIDGELLETLRALRRRCASTKLVLGVRDILDDPERTRPSLQKTHFFETIREYYDEVWIYGSKDIFNAVDEYHFPSDIARKTRFCGYLKRPTTTSERKSGPPRVLVTTGGGGDGSEMIEAYLDGLLALPRRFALLTTVIFGPQMPAQRRTAILERFGYLADVTFLDFEADLTRHYAEADVVVSMAGYNTVCELLSFGRRAVLVPRAEPVREQLIRARLLAKRDYFTVVEPEDLNATTLMNAVLTAIEQGASVETPVDMEGLPRIHDRVRALLSGRNA